MFIISGCSPITISEEQKRQVIASDSDFAKALEQKAALDGRLAELRAAFVSEKDIYESKMDSLHRDFQARKAKFIAEAEQLKGRLNPYREKINAEILIVSGQLKDKRKSQNAIKGMVNQAKQIIEGKISASLTDEDRAQWRKRLDALSEEYNKITQDLAVIKEKLYILKLKLRSLIQ